jgi:D-alanyl-D-alanine carboxypeptidase
MTSTQPARAATRRTSRPIVRGVAALVAVVACALGYHSLADRWPAGSHRDAGALTHPAHWRLGGPAPDDPPGRLDRDRQRAIGEGDGEVPDGVTVFDDDYPAVSHLIPAFLTALRQAATDARGTGIDFEVNSGWRSEKYQRQLFEQAVAEYGSEAQAARWVARPGTSVHESGGAVDLGPEDAADWLSEHGSAYGLCQIYDNEPWHFELRPDAVEHGCPPTYADPTHDPRMQQ